MVTTATTMGLIEMKKHFWNVLGLSLSLLTMAVIMTIAAWQIDYIAGDAIWHYYKPSDTFAFPVWKWNAIVMPVYDAYTKMFAVMAFGAFVGVIGVFISLWWWEE